MRVWFALLMLAAAQPVHAGEPKPPYYGPMKGFWQGGEGYSEKVEKDGTLRVDALTRGDHALDIAMYRAGELARASGHAYVELLGGSGMRQGILYSATLYLRPSHNPASPTACRSKRRSCYTADVAELLRVLGGPGGTQPGVPVVDHYDEHGSEVRISGFGIAAASINPRAAASLPVARYVPPAPPVIAVRVAPAPGRVRDGASAHEQLLKTQRGVRGRESKQGWTISD